jgi:hypothetical protein
MNKFWTLIPVTIMSLIFGMKMGPHWFYDSRPKDERFEEFMFDGYTGKILV